MQSAIPLPALLTIDHVETLATAWRALPTNAPLAFDAAATEIVTAPGAQLLLAFDAQLSRDGGNLVLLHTRGDVAETFQTLGLGAEFARWTADSSITSPISL